MTEALKQKKSGRLAPKIIGLVLIAAAAYLVLCAVADGRDTFYPGCRINGLDVGGLSAAKAAEDLDAAME